MTCVRKVLVTGGCGSIGSAVVTQLSERDAAEEITVFDNDEQKLYALEQERHGVGSEIEYELGDVRDERRLAAAMRDVDCVIHAAGIKQVPQSEYNPYEAMATNAIGTWNVLQAAREVGVESVLTVSTDKAVNPISTMGASKMLAERVTRAAHCRSDDRAPRFGCVRLGNVVGSNGSVVPLFRDQIQNGGPVTITEPEMTRFVMSRAQAGRFIVDRALDLEGGGIHVPKLGRMRLADLARTMIEAYAPPDTPPEQIEIAQIGRRPGERVHEYLVGPTEVERAVEYDDGYVVRPPGGLVGSGVEPEATADLPAGGYRSDTEPFLDRDELVALVEEGLDDVEVSPAVEDTTAVANYDSA